MANESNPILRLQNIFNDVSFSKTAVWFGLLLTISRLPSIHSSIHSPSLLSMQRYRPKLGRLRQPHRRLCGLSSSWLYAYSYYLHCYKMTVSAVAAVPNVTGRLPRQQLLLWLGATADMVATTELLLLDGVVGQGWTIHWLAAISLCSKRTG